ncbi:AraC family transcriptional regulator [Bacteroides thetaiotaomicron]|uniref:AraC family transcriptional regulator n=1 Tax=Bacteroides thetaiotaomicron TaxID=818 RepID=UPI0039B3D5AC
MKNLIPRYTFYKNKYGSELLIDVVELKYVKKFLAQSSVHTLTYYDITFVTEGEGRFSIDNQTNEATSRDVFFSKPGEIRNWDTRHIVNGYALIFEDEFLSSLFKDSLFVQHLSFFQSGKTSSKLQLPDELYMRILQILHNIKTEIDSYRQNDVYVLRALLYEVLMLLDREYKKVNMEEETTSKEVGNIHIDKFMKLVESHLKEQHSVQYYADKLCITPNYLNEIVTSTKGISAKQYIRNKVMDEAQRLLTYTDFPISDIAFELHFSTVSYFIRSFRQYTGTTPLLYRRTHKP